jgi:hypothetical protein
MSGCESRDIRQLMKSISPLVRLCFLSFRRVAGLGYLDKDAVAGSSPAFGSRCRSSSVVEHVNSQFVSYPSVFQRAVDRGLSGLGSGGSNLPRGAFRGGVTQAHRANSTIDFLSAIIAVRKHFSDGPKPWVIAGHWFDSNLLHQMGQ